jgi:glycosyltransferase involved in cell wall biosynthesis
LFQLIKLSRYYNKNVDVVTYQNSFNLESLNKHYTGKIYQINMGCDFSYWKKGNKNEKRKILNIDKNKLVLFTSSRLVREKQIDKLIELIDELDINNGYNFLLIVSGTGDKNYETELIQKANRLSVKSKIQFIGYVVGDELLNYYQAADVIISTSITEGGPVSSMKALACELPIFTTETGLIAEILKKNKSGFVVSKSNPSDWLFYLKKLLENELPKKLDYNLSVSMFDWINVSNKLYNIYKSLYHRYYDDK